jgi:hypothetical protein
VPESTINWCAIGVTEENPQSGQGMITHDGADNGGLGSDTLQVNDEALILASFYGPNARQFANLMRDGMMVPQNREAIELQGYRLLGMPTTGRFIPEIVSQTTYRRVDTTFRIKRTNVTVWPVENIVEVEAVLLTDDGLVLPFSQGSVPPP